MDYKTRITELAIKAHNKKRHADEITERAEAEGWDNDPTGSLHISEAWVQSNKARDELSEVIEAYNAAACRSIAADAAAIVRNLPQHLTFDGEPSFTDERE